MDQELFYTQQIHNIITLYNLRKKSINTYRFTVLNIILRAKLTSKISFKERPKNLRWDVKLSLITPNLLEQDFHRLDFALMKIMITHYKVILIRLSQKF